jgi:DNA-3-methyladenine glycosylase
MHALNPSPSGRRPDHKLLAGQALLAKALDLRVRDWTGEPFDPASFFLEDAGYEPERIVRSRRLGIPKGRDEHLMLRFVDAAHARSATRNPLTRRAWREGTDYQVLGTADPA